MKKKIIALLLVAMVATVAIFASNIGITYKGSDYFITTTISMAPTDTDLYYGYYDAFVAVKEGRQLNEIYQIIEKMAFPDEDGGKKAAEQKNNYIRAFNDFMNHYSYGAMGEFKDVYPIYDQLMRLPVSYKNAFLICEFGAYRFYLKNV